MNKRVFGPVPSRRLGQSLGVDPVPLKTCNWNCIYCQLGRSMPMVNARRRYFDTDGIITQVAQAIESHGSNEIDWVTFVGSGETTLHAGLGEMIRGVKALTDLPVAVITNGSLLYLAEVREAMLTADAVLPSLDAGSAALYRKINRPHPNLTYERLVEGLIRFREEYTHQMWVEVMLIKGINDSTQALEEIAAALNQINPDEVHIVQPTRPPVETWVMPPDQDGLLRARAILGKVAQIIHPATGAFDLSGEDDLVDAIVGIITRHPMMQSELIGTLEAWSPSEVRETLSKLQASGKAQIVERQGVRFWTAAEAYYPKDNSVA
jgi:wyosine [tRNA(Phe)-imidazoG37] synthetase (radical SAM superfamily)